MKTKHHDETAATRPVSKPMIDATLTHRDQSVSEAVQAEIDDNSKPSAEQSLAESRLAHPMVGDPAGQLAAWLPEKSPDDDPGKGHGGSSAGRFKTPADTLRDMTHPNPADDPSRGRGDLQDDLIHMPSREDLAAQLGHENFKQTTDPRKSTDAPGLGHNLQRPDGPPDEGSRVFDSPGHRDAMDMLSTPKDSTTKVRDESGTKHETVTDTTSADGHHWHQVKTVYWSDQPGKQNEVIQYSKDTTSGTEVLIQKSDDGDMTATIYDPKTGKTSVAEHWLTDQQHTIIYDSKTGKVLEDVHPNAGASTPDSEHRYRMPADLDDGLLQETIKNAHLPSHGGDAVNVAGDDIPGTVGKLTGAEPVSNNQGPGGDPGTVQNEDGGLGGTGHNPNQGSGPCYGPDHDEAPQTNGPEERPHQQVTKHDVTGAADNGQSGDRNADEGKPVDTPAETQSETPAEKAAHQLDDASVQHAGSELGQPTKPHDKASMNSDATAAVPDAGSGYADLISAAQNPAAHGLAAQQAPGIHDAANATLSLLPSPVADSMHVPGAEAHAAASFEFVPAHDVHDNIAQHAPVFGPADIHH